MASPGRYRKISSCIWGDAKFRRLSRPQPNAQSLWFYLLTGTHTGIVPGLCDVTEEDLAARLGWSLKAFREAFAECFRDGLAKADWSHNFIHIPNAPKHNPPTNPNVAKHWGSAARELPECALKDQAVSALKDFLKGLGKAYLEAFVKGFGESLPLQEQEQEQEQEENPPTPQGGSAAKPHKVSPSAEASVQALVLPFLSPQFHAAWSDWLVHRKQIRKRVTELAAKQRLTELAKMGEVRAIAAIRHSIGMGWTGVFEPTNGQAEKSADDDPWCRGNGKFVPPSEEQIAAVLGERKWEPRP